jgi:hypothetical protein
LLNLGAEILSLLREPKTVTRLWNELQQMQSVTDGRSIATYDWFVLGLDLLYALGAIELERGTVRKLPDSVRQQVGT